MRVGAAQGTLAAHLRNYPRVFDSLFIMSVICFIVFHVARPYWFSSSNDPTRWTKLVDLSARLPAEVHAFNTANPGAKISLLGKCEFSNPGMSHKDRIAKVMLARAEARGDLSGPDGTKKTVLAASSGNTGCSLALVGSLMGYRVVIITNAKCSDEKRRHIEANGAELWMAEDLPSGEYARELGGEADYMKQEALLAAAFPDRFWSADQYSNGDNTAAHYSGTGREIFEQTHGQVILATVGCIAHARDQQLQPTELAAPGSGFTAHVCFLLCR